MVAPNGEHVQQIDTESAGDRGDLAGQSLRELVVASRSLVCVGTGGVGKTTTAAAIATAAAILGRRAVVVTIDPARRLADALGLEHLPNEPHRVGIEVSGELWAMMLDRKATFDDLVERHAHSDTQAERIFANPFYRAISGALSGTHEYMAAEKLYELSRDERFDLIVVDTPPSRYALDFLEAPGQLSRMLDHKLTRLLMTPGRGMVRVAGFATVAALRTAGRVVGSEVIDDIVAFFQAFEGLEQGFLARSDRVQALLDSPATRFVLVATPQDATVASSMQIAEELRRRQHRVDALVVNRVHPVFAADGGRVHVDERAAAEAVEAARRFVEAVSGEATERWARTLLTHQMQAAAERTRLSALSQELAPGSTALIPLLTADVHELTDIVRIGHWLVGEQT